jgi:hypothetical protein
MYVPQMMDSAIKVAITMSTIATRSLISHRPAANLMHPDELEVGLHICVHGAAAANARPRIVMIGGVNPHGDAASTANNTAPIDMSAPRDMPAGARCRVLRSQARGT